MNTLKSTAKNSRKKAQKTQKVKWFLVLLLLSFLCLFAANRAFAYSGGTGEPNNPYKIADVNNLLQLAADVNNYDKFFILTADINLASYTFDNAVIAPYSVPNIPSFTGNFDGANHKISNLTINTSENSYDLGLFGQIHFRYDIYGNYLSEIKNLTLENVHITISGTVGYSGTIGGLVGNNEGVPITNCHSTVTINSMNFCGYYGGLLGYNFGGYINNCSTEGNIFITSSIGRHADLEIGGLVGLNLEGNIINSNSDCNIICNISEISGPYGADMGGLVGDNYAEYGDSIISNCYSTGTVAANNVKIHLMLPVGGLVGTNFQSYGDAVINKCFSTSPITVTGDGYNEIGGLVGYNSGEVNDCYATGPATGPLDNDYYAGLGGLVGNNYGIIGNCYSIGEVNATTGSFVGGLVGYQYESSIVSSYFLDVNGPDNGLGTPLTDAQMKQQANFVGWDFVGETANGTEDIWRMCEDGVRYPLLYWQFSPADFTCPDGVDFTDFAVLANWWNADNCADNNNCVKTDLDLSGNIDIYDLNIFCDHWLEGL